MTTLLLPDGIDLETYLTNLKIDSFRRCITFASACLRRANNDTLNLDIGVNSPFYNSVQFAFPTVAAPVPAEVRSGKVGQILISAKIWYKILEVLDECFNFQDHLYPYSHHQVASRLTEDTLIASDFAATANALVFPNLPLPSIPPAIDNLEKLLYWSCMQYSMALNTLIHDTQVPLTYTVNNVVSTELIPFPLAAFALKDSVTITPYDNNGFIEILVALSYSWNARVAHSTILAAF